MINELRLIEVCNILMTTAFSTLQLPKFSFDTLKAHSVDLLQN